MKKLVFVLLFAVISCAQQEKESLNLGIWVDNIPQELYDKFTEETGIEVIQTPYTSNEEIYAKVKANPSAYDLIVPSLDYVEIMVNEGLVDPIDLSLVPNISNVMPQMLTAISNLDTSNTFAVPFSFGPTALVYDKTKITNEVRGFEIFTNTDYAGRMLLLNDQREVMGAALNTLGFALDTTNEQELTQTKDLILEWKKNILRFDADSYQVAYANGEVDLVHGYPETVWVNLTDTQKSNTVVLIPENGMMFLDSFVLMKGAKNSTNAHKFINFIQQPENYAQLMDYLEILSLNLPAEDLRTIPSVIDSSQIGNASMLTDIGTDALQAQGRIWEEILTQ